MRPTRTPPRRAYRRRIYRRRRRFRPQFLALVAIITTLGVWAAQIGGALAIEPEEEAQTPAHEADAAPPLPIDISLLQINFDNTRRIYQFYYHNTPLDLNRHHIIDPYNLVRLLTYNPAYNRISVFTDVPAVFFIEHSIYTDNVYITAANPRSVYDKILIIDPGHGGSDAGATVDGINESDITLQISLQLYALFSNSNSGIRVFITRDDDSFVFNSRRSHIAGAVGDLLLSVHTNAYPYDSRVTGTETLYNPAGQKALFGNTGRFNITNAAFSQIAQDHLVAELATRDRGILQRTDILLLNTSTIPTAYVEIDFKTNPQSLANLTDPAYQQRIAQALYRSVIEAFAQAISNE